MSTYDLGDVVRLDFLVTDLDGNPANPSTVTLTVVNPDGTTSTPAVANPAIGTFRADLTPTQFGRHAVTFRGTGSNATTQSDVFEVRDPAYLPLISLAEAKEHLNIPATTTTSDEELRRFLDVATEMVENHCGQIFRRQTVITTRPGGKSFYILDRPVLSVSSVVVNGTTLDPLNYKIALDAGVLQLLVGSGIYPDSVVITYVAGYANPPEIARHATRVLVAHLWETQRGRAGGINRKGDDFAPGSTFTMPNRVAELLEMITSPGFA